MQCYQMEEKWPVIKTTTLKGTAQGTIRREVKWKDGLCSHCKSSMVCLFFLVYGTESSVQAWSMALMKETVDDHETPLHLSVQFSSVTQLCLTLCDPMNHGTPGLPVHHQLPEFTQTHVHRVGDTIQPSHPLSSPSPPAPNPSQHQSLFQ